MRFKHGSVHAFNMLKFRTGLHKLDRETVLLDKGQRGTLSTTHIANMVMHAKDAQSLARKAIARARKAYRRAPK